MYPFKNTKKDEHPEGRTRKHRKLDKIYMISAASLILLWLLTSSGLFPGINFKALSPAAIKASIDERKARDRELKAKEEEIKANNEAAKLQTSMSMGSSRACTDESHVFYIGYDNNAVFMMNKDGSNGREILSENIHSILAKDGWLYYSSGFDGKTKLYKEIGRIKIDGTEKYTAAIPHISNFIVDGEYIYFSDREGFYRSTLQGKDIKKLYHGVAPNFAVYGNGIYITGPETYGLLRIPLDGGGSKQVLSWSGSGSPPTPFGIFKNYVYYLKEDKLIKTKLDEFDPIEIKNDVFNFDIEDDILYYTSSTGLHSSKLDGNDDRTLVEGGYYISYIRNGIAYCSLGVMSYFKDLRKNTNINLPEAELSVAIKNISAKLGDTSQDKAIHKFSNDKNIFSFGDSIFYLKQYDGLSQLMKFDKVTKTTTEGLKETIYNIDKLGSLIFFLDENDFLYSVDINKGDKEKIFGHHVSNYAAVRDGIYFTSAQGKLYKYDFKNDKISKISDDVIEKFLIDGNQIYYTGKIEAATYKINIDGSNKTKILDFSPRAWDVAEGYIYYIHSNDTVALLRNRIGSTEGQFLSYALTEYFLTSDKYIYFKENKTSNFCKVDLEGKKPEEMSVSGHVLAVLDGYVGLEDSRYGMKFIPLSEAFK